MKVGVRAYTFNWNLRKRRAGMGLTQAQLAQSAGIPLYRLQAIEGLRTGGGRAPLLREAMHKIVRVLGCKFEELFPPEYLDALQKKVLPGRKAKYLWCVETSLERLPAHDPARLVEPDLDDLILREQLHEEIDAVLKELVPREREVLELRFGFRDGRCYTQAEVGKRLRVTKERIRQIERMALARIRNPLRAHRLKPYLEVLGVPVDAIEGADAT